MISTARMISAMRIAEYYYTLRLDSAPRSGWQHVPCLQQSRYKRMRERVDLYILYKDYKPFA